MEDVKSAFGLGGQTGTAITNIKNDLLSLATLIENTLIPKIDKMASSLATVAKSFGSVLESSKSSNLLIADKHGRITGKAGDEAASKDGNRVAPAPTFTETKPPASDSKKDTSGGIGGGGSNNRVAAAASFGSVAAGLGYGANALSAALPSTDTSVLQDYMTVRSGFYGIGGGGSQQDQSKRIHDLQKQLANQGTMTDSMDSTKAIYAGQKLGLTGYSNFSTGKNSVIAGAASISNLEPGLGGEGAMQAQAALAKPTAVNMLRTIGISMVDAKGNLTTTAQMIDKLWDFIMRSDGPKALTVEAIQFEATPGHGLYNMLSKLFNGNNDMIQIVVDGLIMKAKLKGASVANLTRAQMQKAGGTSATINQIAAKTAAQTSLLADTASATSAGYGASAELAKAMNRFADLSPGLVGALGAINGFLTGFKAIGGGFLSSLAGMFLANKFMGEGGGFGGGGGGLFKGKGGLPGGFGGTAETVATDTAAMRWVDPVTGAAYPSKSAAEAYGAVGLKKEAGLLSKSKGFISNAMGKGKNAAKGLFKGFGKFLSKNWKKLVTGAEIAGEEAQAAAAEVGTLGTLGTVDEIATQALVASQLAGLSGKATGGPVSNKTPYIVGEKGPELFVPNTDGTIIPNHVIGKQEGGKVTEGGFAKSLLKGLGAPVTAQNIKDVTMWEHMEGGNWHNTAHFNPLNTSYQAKGSTNFDTGKSGGGVQAYTSWKQGLDSTIGTLTGANAEKRGYTNIIDTLKSGKASKDDFLKALQGSAWDAGRYGGGSSSSRPSLGGSSGGSSRGGTSSSSVSSTNADIVSRGLNQAQVAWGAIGGGTAGDYNHNYGGVTINVNAAGLNHDAIVKMFSDMFTSKGISAKISG